MAPDRSLWKSAFQATRHAFENRIPKGTHYLSWAEESRPAVGGHEVRERRGPALLAAGKRDGSLLWSTRLLTGAHPVIAALRAGVVCAEEDFRGALSLTR